MPRKTPAVAATAIEGNTHASMRPRPDAAENQGRQAGWGCSLTRASMRPRPDAAENPVQHRGAGQTGPASMRPRPDAAENQARFAETYSPEHRFNEAAARCRGKPRTSRPASSVSSCFNEAAARCRGKPLDGSGLHSGVRQASMRPRPDAAENRRGKPSISDLTLEASMRPRPDAAENPRRIRHRLVCCRGFNEAAARCRGKPSLAARTGVFALLDALQ